MTPARFSPQAHRDVAAAARWIANDNRIAARAFRNVIARAAQRLGDHPLIGREWPEMAAPPVRFLTLKGFPFVLELR